MFWFLSGDTNEANLREKGIDIWKEWADEEHTRRLGREAGDMGPIYGYLWRSFGGHYPKRDGVDQIARLINEIETNPNSRRLIVSGWDPRECDNVDLPPCHTLFQFKIEQGDLLHCQLYQRSADAFLGVPFNISSYALLTHLVAHVCDLRVGEFIYTLGDYHIYKNHLEQVETLPGGHGLRLAMQGGADAVIKAAANYSVVSLTSHEPSLEDIFLRYYEGDDLATKEESHRWICRVDGRRRPANRVTAGNHCPKFSNSEGYHY